MDIRTKLYDLASQENCDGEPYDTMQDAADYITQLEQELETERMRLAACGAAALANTPDSAAKVREMQDQYKSASLDDVIQIVDSEMALRKERDELKANIDHLLNDCHRFTDKRLAENQAQAIEAAVEYVPIQYDAGHYSAALLDYANKLRESV